MRIAPIDKEVGASGLNGSGPRVLYGKRRTNPAEGTRGYSRGIRGLAARWRRQVGAGCSRPRRRDRWRRGLGARSRLSLKTHIKPIDWMSPEIAAGSVTAAAGPLVKAMGKADDRNLRSVVNLTTMKTRCSEFSRWGTCSRTVACHPRKRDHRPGPARRCALGRVLPAARTFREDRTREKLGPGRAETCRGLTPVIILIHTPDRAYQTFHLAIEVCARRPRSRRARDITLLARQRLGVVALERITRVAVESPPRRLESTLVAPSGTTVGSRNRVAGTMNHHPFEHIPLSRTLPGHG